MKLIINESKLDYHTWPRCEVLEVDLKTGIAKGLQTFDGSTNYKPEFNIKAKYPTIFYAIEAMYELFFQETASLDELGIDEKILDKLFEEDLTSYAQKFSDKVVDAIADYLGYTHMYSVERYDGEDDWTLSTGDIISGHVWGAVIIYENGVYSVYDEYTLNEFEDNNGAELDYIDSEMNDNYRDYTLGDLSYEWDNEEKALRGIVERLKYMKYEYRNPDKAYSKSYKVNGRTLEEFYVDEQKTAKDVELRVAYDSRENYYSKQIIINKLKKLQKDGGSTPAIDDYLDTL